MTQFGTAIREAWQLETGLAYLNHGSFGATARPVLEAQARRRARMELNPGRFMRDEAPSALDDARAALAGFLGAAPDDLVFVDNATAACNAVLRSLTFAPGDEVVGTNHGYHAVRQTIRFVTERAGAKYREITVPFPDTTQACVVAAIEQALSPRTKLLVIDHVTSHSALVLPVAEIAAIARERGVPVLVDGAHTPGMLALDLPRLGVDWYAGNCHKWLCAPRGAGFLWAHQERQPGIHPPVISHYLDEGFQTEFSWQGTRDPTSWLSVPDALAFRARLGEGDIGPYCSGLIADVVALLGDAWGITDTTPAAMRGFMVTMPLPVPVAAEKGPALRRALLRDHAIEANFVPVDGQAWIRLSAFLYNTLDDYRRLAAALPRIADAHKR